MRITRFLCLLLIAALLAGCTPASPAETTAPTVPETTVPEETLVQGIPAIPENDLPEVEGLAAVNKLSNQKFNESPGVAILDHRTAVFLTTEYLKAEGIAVSHLMALDLYTDTVLAETTINTAVALPPQSHLPGFLPLFDQTSDRCIVLDRNLNEIYSFSCPEKKGVFAPDLSAYYFISAQRICRLDLESGEWDYMDNQLALPVESIRDYHVEENILLVNVHTQYYLTNLCVGAVDLDTGAVLLLTNDAKNCTFTPDGLLMEQQELVTNSDLVHVGWNQEVSTKITDAMPVTDVYSSWFVPFSDYLVTLHYDHKNAYNLDSCMLYRFTDEYVGCQLYDLTGKLEPDKLISLPGGNLLAVDFNRRATKMVLICPEQLEFSPVSEPEQVDFPLTDATIVENYQQQAAYVEVPGELAQVREQADALEEKYDITILMANQCDPIITQVGMEIQPWEQGNLEAYRKQAKNALEELDESLEMYPDQFFSQFRNSAHERGILVLLVGNISIGLTDDNVDVLGVTYDMGDWYPIAVDISTKDLPATYCHEIWHAMENKIMDTNPSLLNDVNWGWNNPEGFSYKGVVDGYYNDTADTYVGGNCGRDSYFVDSYGKTMPQEDRARLMEYMMTSERDIQYMMEAPVLYKKMQMMIDAVRGVFDTTGWSEIRWERFHQ